MPEAKPAAAKPLPTGQRSSVPSSSAVAGAPPKPPTPRPAAPSSPLPHVPAAPTQPRKPSPRTQQQRFAALSPLEDALSLDPREAAQQRLDDRRYRLDLDDHAEREAQAGLKELQHLMGRVSLARAARQDPIVAQAAQLMLGGRSPAAQVRAPVASVAAAPAQQLWGQAGPDAFEWAGGSVAEQASWGPPQGLPYMAGIPQPGGAAAAGYYPAQPDYEPVPIVGYGEAWDAGAGPEDLPRLEDPLPGLHVASERPQWW